MAHGSMLKVLVSLLHFGTTCWYYILVQWPVMQPNTKSTCVVPRDTNHRLSRLSC
jgi:hypothetical protein